MAQQHKEQRNIAHILQSKSFRSYPVIPYYLVSSCGNYVINSKTNRILVLSPQIIKGKPSGYIYVSLFNHENKLCRTSVHRLVAMTWLEVPPDAADLWVNHKDGNKSNNDFMNLEWTTISENLLHKARILCKTNKGVNRHKPLSNEAKLKMSEKRKAYWRNWRLKEERALSRTTIWWRKNRQKSYE